MRAEIGKSCQVENHYDFRRGTSQLAVSTLRDSHRFSRESQIAILRFEGSEVSLTPSKQESHMSQRLPFQFNDGGRSERFRGLAGDCVARSIAIASGLPYQEVYRTVSRVCRWTMNAADRRRVAAGEDIFFVTPAAIPLTPHSLHVGYPWRASSAAEEAGGER